MSASVVTLAASTCSSRPPHKCARLAATSEGPRAAGPTGRSAFASVRLAGPFGGLGHNQALLYGSSSLTNRRP
jgi:hypothetical protein